MRQPRRLPYRQHFAQPIDVPLDNMTAELIADLQRALQIHAITSFEIAHRRQRQTLRRHFHDVAHAALMRLSLHHSETHAIVRNARADICTSIGRGDR
jgi:hypothetical protein